MKAFGPGEFILEMNDQGALLAPDYLIPYSLTNLSGTEITFRKKPTYWRVRKKSEDASTGYLKVEIIDYNDKEYLSHALQEKEFAIKTLEFDLLDWSRLDPILIGYKINKLERVLYNKSNYLNQTELSKAYEKSKKLSTYNDVLQVQFEKARFREGMVSLDSYIEGSVVQVDIYNQFIRLEFDLIKKWFIKKFEKKWFSVVISANLIGRNVIEVSASSAEIASIDETFIETFQEYYIQDLLKKGDDSVDTILKPLVDFIRGDDLGESLFAETGDVTQLVKRIITVTKVRNKRELDHLSAHPLIQKDKIQITRPPQVGFIFGFQNEHNFIYVWELLNSNATYVWIFNKRLSQEKSVDILNQRISIIFQEKRMAYRKWEREQKSDDFSFHLVEHNLKDEDGFNDWQAEIDRLLNI